MYAQVAIKPNPLLRNGAYGIVMRGVQKCTRGCSSLRGRNKLPLCCIKLDTATDPACGSGAMFLASAWAMKRKGIDYQKKCLFIGRDIDIRCVWMAYIQMFLYQIPGIVVHGNTITMEEWSEWVTPYALLSLSQDKNPSAAQQKEEIPA